MRRESMDGVAFSLNGETSNAIGLRASAAGERAGVVGHLDVIPGVCWMSAKMTAAPSRAPTPLSSLFARGAARRKRNAESRRWAWQALTGEF
jgi:hypothetical protein